MWYKSQYTNQIISSSAAKTIVSVFGDNSFDAMIEKGELEMIEDPNVIDIIKSGSPMAFAIERYRQIHGGNVADARKMVSIIKRDIIKANGIG